MIYIQHSKSTIKKTNKLHRVFHQFKKNTTYFKSMLSPHNLLYCMVYVCAIYYRTTQENILDNQGIFLKGCVSEVKSVLLEFSLDIPYHCCGCHNNFLQNVFLHFFSLQCNVIG